MTDLDTAADRLAATGARLADTSTLLAQAALEVQRLAGPVTPRRTGALAASVTVQTDTDGASVRWGVPYARFVNFGTRYMPARPFATGALAAAEPVVEQLATAWVTEILEGT